MNHDNVIGGGLTEEELLNVLHSRKSRIDELEAALESCECEREQWMMEASTLTKENKKLNEQLEIWRDISYKVVMEDKSLSAQAEQVRQYVKKFLIEKFGDRCPYFEPCCSLCNIWQAFDIIFVEKDE